LKRAIAILLTAWPCAMVAQDAGGTLLPEIDPQDIEIRGDFTARFTGITRQPILGFSPTPRVYRINPNRMPFIESQAQVVASLPIRDIDRPQGPGFAPRPFPDRNRAVLNAAIGNHFTPEVRLVAEVPTGSEGAFLIDGAYVSSDGTSATQPLTSFRFMNGDLAYRHRFSGNRSFTVGTVGRWDFSHLNDGADAAGVNEQIEAGGYLRYHRKRTVFAETDIRIASTYAILPFGTDEILLDGSFNHSLTLPNPGQWVDFGLASRNGLVDWGVQGAHLRYHTRMGATLQASIGGRLYYGWDTAETGVVKLYPDLTVAFKHVSGITFKAELGGRMENDGLAGHAAESRLYNQYADPRNESYWNARGLLQYAYRTGFRVEGGVEARLYDTVGFFELAGANLTRSYADGHRVRVHGATSVDIVPERLTAFGTVYLQSAWVDGGRAMPFAETVGARGGLSTRPAEPILMSIWTDWTGSRPASRTGQPQNGYVLVGASFDYRINRRFGLSVKGTNLLNQNHNPWVGYPVLPIQAYGGFRLII
jgi:hypothetical protein